MKRHVEIFKNNTITGDITATGDIDIHHDVTVGGTLSNGFTGFAFPILTFGPFSGPDFVLNEDENGTAAPDNYDRMRGGKDAEIHLSAGVYNINRFLLDADGDLFLDLSNGPVTINVYSRLLMRKNVKFKIEGATGSSKDLTINYAGTNKVVFDKDGEYFGNIIAPNARVKFGSNSLFHGSVCAKRIDMRKDSRAFFHDLAPLAKGLANETTTGDEQAVTSFELAQNFPNPFNPTTKINFALPEAGKAKLVVYDIMGRSIKTLANREFKNGRHEVSWNGRNQAGQLVAAGTYIYRLSVQRANGETEAVFTKKMVFVK